MSIVIKIGNATNRKYYKSGKVMTRYVDVETIELDTAPVFPNDGLTGNSNYRSPATVGWYDFIGNVGLKDLFYDAEHGLMYKTGSVLLTQTHSNIIRDKLAEWKKKYPDSKPGFEGSGFHPSEVKLNYIPDTSLARLMWLDFWVNWAVKYCDMPVLYCSY